MSSVTCVLLLFRVMATGKHLWEDKWNGKWASTTPPVLIPSSMYTAGSFGPYLYRSETVSMNKFFGLASRHDTKAVPLNCVPLDSTWATTSHGTLPRFWFSERLWEVFGGDGQWSESDVIQRSTCKASHPMLRVKNPFKGRCPAGDGKHIVSVSNSDTDMTCLDSLSPLGHLEFQQAEDYEDYLKNFEQRLNSSCECIIFSEGQPSQLRSLSIFLPVDRSKKVKKPNWKDTDTSITCSVL